MGFFSWNCKSKICQHRSVISEYSETEKTAWMKDVVVITEDNQVLMGEYDGYGRVEGTDIAEYDGMMAVWHRACWELEGKSLEYDGPSDYSADQGYFFTDDQEMEDPREFGTAEEQGLVSSELPFWKKSNPRKIKMGELIDHLADFSHDDLLKFAQEHYWNFLVSKSDEDIDRLHGTLILKQFTS
jgi:hypothetical protein